MPTAHKHDYRRDYLGRMTCVCGDVDISVPVFDSLKSEKERESALSQVDANASDGFKTLALQVVQQVAAENYEFTVDLPRERFAANHPNVKPHEPRAWGVIMRTARTRKFITPTERFQPTTQVKSHRQPRRIWRSLLLPAPVNVGIEIDTYADMDD